MSTERFCSEEHDRVYAPYSLPASQLSVPWACRKCGMQGIGAGLPNPADPFEYYRVIARAG